MGEQMNRLTIRNFGPIKDATLNLNKINLLIGTQGSGKSTIAKLLAILNDPTLALTKSPDSFFKDYNIDFELTDDTFIEYSTPLVSIKIRGKHIEHGLVDIVSDSKVNNFEQRLWEHCKGDDLSFLSMIMSLSSSAPTKDTVTDYILKAITSLHEEGPELSLEQRKELTRIFLTSMEWERSFNRCVYIPAERNIVPLIADNFFAMGDSMGLPKCIWKFGANYERARKSYESNSFSDIPFVDGLHYRRSNKKDEILYHGVINSLAQGSSGFQSSVPLAVVCSASSKTNRSLFIIEEPEQNLYPVTQYNLVKFLAENCLQNENKLLITTHSPYIVTSLINLIQAHASGKVKPRVTAKIIPKTQWIDFEDVSAYFIDEGTSKDIVDYDEQTILAEAIDNASADIGNEYSKLLEIAYSKK